MVFSDCSLIITDKHNFSFSPPLSMPKLVSEFTWEELTPTPLLNQALSKPFIKTPFNAAMTSMSRLGAHFDMPSTKHDLQPANVLSWDCQAAIKRLQDPEASSAAWTYLDGSASARHFGCAFVQYNHFNTQPCDVIASASPLLSSRGSEFWALHVKLHSLTLGTENAIHFILCDSSNAVSCFQLAKDPTFALMQKHTSGNWIKSFGSSIAHFFFKGVRVEVKWIKAHTRFQGNEMAYTFAKWASFAISASSLVLPPPQKRSITL